MIGPMLRELVQARGRAKLEVLKKYDDPDIREILKYTYNTDFVYGIKPDPVSVLNIYDRQFCLDTAERFLLGALLAKSLTGGKARQAVAKSSQLVRLILSRDLQCGIAATSINKVMHRLIPEFKVQLAKEVPLHKVKFPCYAQLKYDGVRIVTTIKDDVIKFRTRNGKTVPLPKLAKIIRDAGIRNVMLDGEMVIRGGNMTDRTRVSGMINSAMHGGQIVEERLEYAIFDYMSIGAFEACESEFMYSVRYKGAESMVNAIDNDRVVLARNDLVKSPKEVEDLAKQLYADGMEGLILKHPTHYYSFKRSKEWVKIKETKTVDLTVVGAVEGAGQFQGMVGALDCIGVAEGRNITVAVGSGLSTTQRAESLDAYNNLTVEVAYNSVIKDSRTGEWSLFLPRLVCVRFDK